MSLELDVLVLKLADNVQEIKQDVKDLAEKFSLMETTLVRLTDSVEHHVARTDELQAMVLPLYQDKLKKEAIKEYKASRRRVWMNRLKIPGAIVAAATATAAILKFLLGGL